MALAGYNIEHHPRKGDIFPDIGISNDSYKRGRHDNNNNIVIIIININNNIIIIISNNIILCSYNNIKLHCSRMSGSWILKLHCLGKKNYGIKVRYRF